jgi:K+/H+ antiporter YhaU regulatory subunit KhtT
LTVLHIIITCKDAIRGFDQAKSLPDFSGLPPKVIVAVDSQSLEDVVIVGINAADRPGLLLSISKGLHSIGLQLHHTEASVILDRSVSVWRCEFIEKNRMEPEEIEESLKALLEKEVGAGATLSGGMPVIRVQVTDKSSLAGVSLANVDFMSRYRAAVMAVSKADGSKVEVLREVCFAPDDILVLQAKDDSPLLVRPPPDFYTAPETSKRNSSAVGFFRAVNPTSLFKSEFQRNASSVDLQDIEANANEVEGVNQLTVSNEINEEMVNAWRDLRVVFHEKEDDDVGNAASREYLDARRVSPKSEHIGKNVMQAGLDKLVGLFLVEVERPLSEEETKNRKKTLKTAVFSDSGLQDSIDGSMMGSSHVVQRATVVPPEDPLKAGDIIWFAGSAEAIVDLRKVPGLESTQKEVLEGVNENKFDRRLVQGKFSLLHLQSIVSQSSKIWSFLLQK